MKINWPQIKLKNVLWAVFWLSLSGAAFALDYKPADQNPPLLFAIIGTGVLSPFIAIGALFGRPALGLAGGAIVIGGYALFVFVGFRMGWLVFDPTI